MVRNAGRRFWLEIVLTALTGALSLLTLVSRQWIEAVFHVDPDGGDGSLEWLVVAVLLVATVTFAALARAEWRRKALLES